MSEPSIIFEDKSLLVINKPSGWIVNTATTTNHQPIIQEWVAANVKSEIANNKEYRSGIVHRLDKETSGLLIVAKTKTAFANLQEQFKQRKVQKKYWALVHGTVHPPQGEIKAPVGRLPWRRDRFGVLPGGRSAATKYKVQKHYNGYTLLELEPKTGRTHQIRIHLKYLGHPVVGDSFYAGRKTARADRKWCPRLFLHAAEISFLHPQTGKKLAFKSALPEELKTALTFLEE